MKSSPAPSAVLGSVATKARSPVSTGPVQGAARKPATLPIRNAPARPAPPTEFSRGRSPCGSASSKAPNMRRGQHQEEHRQADAPPPGARGGRRRPPRYCAATTPSAAKTTPIPTT